MKYIIKNCPAINDRLCKLEKGLTHCVDVSNCILKQIVEKCKENYANENHGLADEILSLLEIEEVNE